MGTLASMTYQCGWMPEAVKGDPGLTITVTPSSIAFNTGKSAMVTVNVDVYRGQTKLAYGDDGYLCSTLTSTGPGYITAGLRWSFGVTDEGGFHFNLFYTSGNEISMIIPFTVTVDGVGYPSAICVQTVRNGTNGTGSNGENGVWVPPPMLWEDYDDDYMFQAGDPTDGDVRLDMVVVKSSSGSLIPYYCRVTHFKGDSPYSPETDSEYWAPADAGVYKCLATDLLLARNARIEFVSGQAFRVGEGSNMCGYFGAPTSNGVVLYTGSDNDSDATFRVYKSGRVEATDMHLSGNSTFRGFVFHEKTEITAANYALMSISKTYAPGYTRTELDLMKTGNWIEIKSLPATYTSHYTSLPAIRTGEAYTDAYRDYVRQFMGNEIMIYNTSGKSIAIDTGESSVEIRDDYACYFRMIMAPETSNGIKLERIKWEYTGPFRY